MGGDVNLYVVVVVAAVCLFSGFIFGVLLAVSGYAVRVEKLTKQTACLSDALADLVRCCEGADGMLKNGGRLDTRWAQTVLKACSLSGGRR